MYVIAETAHGVIIADDATTLAPGDKIMTLDYTTKTWKVDATVEAVGEPDEAGFVTVWTTDGRTYPIGDMVPMIRA